VGVPTGGLRRRAGWGWRPHKGRFLDWAATGPSPVDGAMRLRLRHRGGVPPGRIAFKSENLPSSASPNSFPSETRRERQRKGHLYDGKGWDAKA
jgi:hypothetical protein